MEDPDGTLVPLQRGPADGPVLICVPQAGSGAASFNDFAQQFSGRASVWAARFPGREKRLLESPLRSIEDMASSLVEPVKRAAAQDIMLLGHCSGAFVALELAHMLTEDYGRWRNAWLAVSAQAPPRAEPGVTQGPMSSLSQEELIEQLRVIGGTPEKMLANAELMELLAPGIRADFEAVERYRPPADRPKLAMPIVALRARDDVLISDADLLAWEDYTSAEFRVGLFDGGHFYLAGQGEAVHRLMMALFATDSGVPT